MIAIGTSRALASDDERALALVNGALAATLMNP